MIERKGDAQMKRICLILLCLLICLCAPALADGVCRISGGALQSGVTTDCSYVSIACPVEQPGQVLVSIYAPDGSLAWQCDYGQRSQAFTTDDIYLKLSGSSATYTAVVQTAAGTYRFPIVRQMARLRGNTACTAGYPLRSITGSDTWETATILHLPQLSDGSMTVPVYASGRYVFGSATLSARGGALTVSVQLANGLDGTVDQAVVYVATDARTAQQLGKRAFSGATGRLNEPIAIGNAEYAAVYVNLTVSFEPSTAQTGIPSQPERQQIDLWEQMQTFASSGAVG